MWFRMSRVYFIHQCEEEKGRDATKKSTIGPYPPTYTNIYRFKGPKDDSSVDYGERCDQSPQSSFFFVTDISRSIFFVNAPTLRFCFFFETRHINFCVMLLLETIF
eukprot:GEMP01084773.1.p1 GENE.GEMP01084773.1~~GEMP01084773.1.p1  ORF type:complete len:106 (-),score=0.57 GEMP01084773.1:326-643(-)